MANPLRRTPHPHLLQINARVWVRELTARTGAPATLADVPDAELARIRDRGFHGVWLLGVWTTGPASRRLALEHRDLLAEYGRVLPDWEPRDVGGSPFSIRDYGVPPELGGNEALAVLRDRLRELGLGLVLDFVPNHLARDHPWLDTHPERLVTGTARDLAADPANWFVHNGTDGVDRVFAHGRDPYFPGWSDTCQIDVRGPTARAALTRLLLELAERCDGLRCDVAMLLLPDVFRQTWGDLPEGDAAPADFWPEAIAALRAAHPDFVLIAEVYWNLEPRLIEAGFDFAYDKNWLDGLEAGDVPATRARLAAALAAHRHLVRFLENHDEPRALAVFGEERLPAAAVLSYTLPCLRFFQRGQAGGARLRAPVQLTRVPAAPEVPGCRELYDRLWRLLARPVFHSGEWAPLVVIPFAPGDGAAAALLGSHWRLDDETWLVVVNLGSDEGRARLPVPLNGADDERVRVHDAWSGRNFEYDLKELREPGLPVILPGFGIHVLRIPHASAAS